MKAIVRTKYGPPEVLHLAEVDKPVPKDDEIMIKVHAATVTLGDCELRIMKVPNLIWLLVRIYMGIFRPRIKILGQELAGEIESIGKHVTQFRAGDKVFAGMDMKMGAYAEYRCLKESHPIAIKSSNLRYEEVATLPAGGINGLHFVRLAKVKKGEKLLINGAGGSIGTYALQIAKLEGAEVTCVDSAIKLEMLKDLGADHVIDYREEDFTRNGQSYDIIIDVVGNSSFSRCLRSLTKNGRYVLGNPNVTGMLRGALTSLMGTKKVLFNLADIRLEDLNHLAGLMERKEIKAVIDKRYELEEIQEAHRYVEAGHKKGNLVVAVG